MASLFLLLLTTAVSVTIHHSNTLTITTYSNTDPCNPSPCSNNFECAADSTMAECTCSGASCDISGKLLINVTLSLSNEIGATVDNTPYDVVINGVGATAFVSSYSSEGGALDAFDSDYETYWHSSYTSGIIPSTMKVVFNEPQPVVNVKLYKRNDPSSWSGYGGLCVFIKVSFVHVNVHGN